MNVKLVNEYQLALRIPRQHYKHLEKLRFEEMVEQRDKIIAQMKKKGIDYNKKGSLIKRPDKSLSLPDQLDEIESQMTGGANAAAE